MTSIDFIRESFHYLASMLVWPVLIGLIVLLVGTLYALGDFLRQSVTRGRNRHAGAQSLIARLDIIAAEIPADTDLDLKLEEAIQLHDQQQLKSIGRVRMAIRIGPSLGLMGTLIPMADALQGLADGNLPKLASNMVTAFAATVVGLFISILAYWIATVRESWAREDSRTAAFAAERIIRSNRECNLGPTKF